MLQLRILGVATSIIGALVSQPAAAQNRGAVSTLTHVVSVTVPARVKVKVSSASLMKSRSVSAAVRVSPASGAMSGLLLTVRSNQAWVLSVSASATGAAKSAKVLWSGSETGEFTSISAADSLLAAGAQSPASVDTTVFFREAKNAAVESGPVTLTVSAP